MTGTESLLQLSADLRQTAPNVRAWFDHSRAAELMEKAADALERLAPLDPDLEAEKSDT
jgi:hypothetical protein